jgi:hypothetical protein
MEGLHVGPVLMFGCHRALIEQAQPLCMTLQDGGLCVCSAVSCHVLHPAVPSPVAVDCYSPSEPRLEQWTIGRPLPK